MATLSFGNIAINMNQQDLGAFGGFFSGADFVLDSLSATEIVARDPGTDTLVTLNGAFDLNSQTTANQSFFADLTAESSTAQLLLSLQGVSTTVGSLLNTTNLSTYLQNLLSGADVVLGGDQNDVLRGFNSDDFVSGGDGDDSVSGDDGNDSLQGGAGIDTLTGGSGNDTLDGGLGNDSLAGGGGNDIYLNVEVGDTVAEQSGQGIDTILTEANLSVLPSNVENLILLGVLDNNGQGNGLNNVISGNSGSNTLQGNGGNDTLDGGAGNDTLEGGAGNDTFVVNDAGDTIVEAANNGTDQVISTVTFSLANIPNVEKLTLTGTADIDGVGNGSVNAMVGNAGDNAMSGGDANDNIQGGDGDDALGGDAGNDVLKGDDGNDTLNGGAGADNMTGGAGDDTFVLDVAGDVVSEAGNGGTDTVRAGLNYTLGANLENLVLTGTDDLNGNGNSGNNDITGNDGNNTLDGKAGTDTLRGGLGDDTLIVDNVGDTVVEDNAAGEDTVKSSVTFTLGGNLENLVLTGSAAINGTGNGLDNEITGNGAANALVGNAGNDTLNGGAGIDNMTGGIGDDIYVINTLSDLTNENPGEGDDTIQTPVTLNLTTRANIENVTLIGTAAINATGDAGANILTGNNAVNTLNGGGGSDTLNGGKGNDTYVVNNAGVTVTEDFASAQGGGVDLVQSSVDFTLSGNIEKLTLTGTDSIDGTGNGSNNTLAGNSGNNVLDGLGGNDNMTGGAGNDTMTGGAGNDTMTGGAGNDTYVVDAAGDVVTEAANGGTDTVQASITYTLGANLENLTLLLNAAINGTGNSVANEIVGNSGSNKLNGLGGNDTLTGGDLADIFRFTTAPNTATNVDTITDFLSGTDSIELENSVYTKLTVTGPLNANNFFSGADITDTSGADANDFIKYDTGSGALYYDTNGNAAGGLQQFAALTGAPALVAADIDVT